MARPIPQWQHSIVAGWLKETRLRQRRRDGEPWSQDDLLADLLAVTGKKLHRPNYSAYESRGSMEPATLRLFVDYWASKEEPGPVLVEPTPVAVAELPPLDLALRALVHELTSARGERDALAERTEALERAVQRKRTSRRWAERHGRCGSHSVPVICGPGHLGRPVPPG